MAADLAWAHLQGANLAGANLEGANLAKANLSGADLTEATITQAQLKEAIGDETTRLPHNRERPAHWGMKTDGQGEGD